LSVPGYLGLVDRARVTKRPEKDPGNLRLEFCKRKRFIISGPRHWAVPSCLLENLFFRMAKNQGQCPRDVAPIKRGFKLSSKTVHNAHNLKPLGVGNPKFELLREALGGRGLMFWLLSWHDQRLPPGKWHLDHLR
jgi:hypothetical protein